MAFFLLALIWFFLASSGQQAEPDVEKETTTAFQLFAKKDTRDNEHYHAAYAKIGTLGKPALPILIRELRTNPDREIRTAAADLLGELLIRNESLVLNAAQILEVSRAIKEDGSVFRITNLLGTLNLCHKRGADLRPTFPDVLASTKHGDGCTRVLCLQFLARHDEKNREQMIGQLYEHMTKPAPGEQHSGTASDALRQLGPLAKSLIPSLKACLTDEAVHRRLNAATLLCSIDLDNWETYLPVLLDIIKAPEAHHRFWAMCAFRQLGHLPPKGREQVHQALQKLLKDEDQLIKSNIQEVIADFKKVHEPNK